MGSTQILIRHRGRFAALKPPCSSKHILFCDWYALMGSFPYALREVYPIRREMSRDRNVQGTFGA
jgi:hypothetical protein